MAGDWIKMRAALVDHPKVIAMTRNLQRSKPFREWLTPGGSGYSNGQLLSDHALRLVTTSLLMKVWSIAREHGRFVGDDLVLPHSEVIDLDQMAGAPSVGSAMESVQWALPRDGVTLPNFKEFNVPMTPAEKQRAYRERHEKRDVAVTDELPGGGNGNGQNVTSREEKSREDKEIKILAPSPAGSTPFHEELNLSPVFIELPLNTGKTWSVREALVAEWQTLFPAVDVRQQLRSMRAWLDANKSRRKTARGIKAFVARWLAKDQDRGPPTGRPRTGAGELGAKEFD